VNLYESPEYHCFKPLWGTHAKTGVVWLEYAEKVLSVSVLSPYGITPEKCFDMKVNLDNGGYLAVSGSAGMQNLDYHEIMSIWIMDPMFDDSNRLMDEKHKKKAERVKYSKSEDVLHKNKVEYKDMNELVRLVNIELHSYRKL